MKTPILPRLCLLGTLALLGHAATASAQTSFTWNAGIGGNWSDGTKWSTGTAPAFDGSSAVTITGAAAAFTATADTAWSTAGAVSGLTFTPGTAGGFSLTQQTSGATFSIGASGITIGASSGAQTFNLSNMQLLLGASQTWNVGASATLQLLNSNSSGAIVPLSDGGNAVTLTKTGTGTLTFRDVNAASLGASSTIVLNQGTLQISTSAGTISQLGNAALQWQNNGNTSFQIGAFLTGSYLANGTLSNNIQFSDIGSGNFTLNPGAPGAGAALNFSGNWSGTLTHQLVLLTNPSAVNNFSTGVTEISGNNTGLAFTGGGNVWARGGVWVLNNANALGTGNSVGITVGDGSTTSYTLAGLLATSGNNVTGAVQSNLNTLSGTAVPTMVEFGLYGTGAVTFSGAVKLAVSAIPAQVPSIFLNASTGGVATFSGQIADGNTGTLTLSPVFIRGGGEVVMSNASGNTYGGGTLITNGSALAVLNTSGSGTGGGAVAVGYAGTSGITGTTQTGTSATIITGVSSTTGLKIGQTITGTGIPAGAYIVGLTATTITLSQGATAAATVADLAGGAEAGILGGGGIVRPSGTNAITVASGSSIYPGVGGTIPTTLTLDGGLTTAPLLTMQSGAAFTFNLGASNAGDLIKFLNFASGDLLLNGNALNFTGAQAGTFTLMQFYADGGSTPTADGIASGLVLGSGLGGFNATLNYDANDISLVLTAAPEPSVAALALLSLAALAGLRAWALRRREAGSLS